MAQTSPPGGDLRVIHLAPHAASSGVGDYADDFARAVAPYVTEVIAFRHAGPRQASVREIRRERRRLRALVAQVRSAHPGDRLVVHSELSGGAVVPFWAILGLPDVHRTATLHDAPRAVWFPFLTRGVGRSRVLNQALHRPLHPASTRLERRALREVDLFALTANGVRASRELGIGRSVTRAQHVLPTMAATVTKPPSARPRAVGLFGHVYTGKGFDLIPALRRGLPADLDVVVAGRGTEALPRTAGVEVLGAVEGQAEVDFFASVRVLVMPYTRPPVGGRRMLPASGAHLRAVVSGTPSIALRSPDTEHLAEDGLCELVDGGPAALAAAAGALAADEPALDAVAARLAAFVAASDTAADVQPFLRAWSRS